MAVVIIDEKYQVVIPQQLRRKLGLLAGDLLDVRCESGRITITPKSATGRAITESLSDFKKGRTYGPFKSVEETVASIKHELGKRAKQRRGVG